MSLTYLALGDSYTIGESVPLSESFPHLLAAQLKVHGIEVAPPTIIARTGWTSDELLAALKTAALTSTFDLVSLLIGVNNQYRGYPPATYQKEFAELLQSAIVLAGGLKQNVFVISIPDWGLTPFGLASGRNIQVTSDEIDAFNQLNKAATLAAGVTYVDVTGDSRRAVGDLALVASDGLHYSAKMHSRWVSCLVPEILSR